MVLSSGHIRSLGTPAEVLREEILQDVFACPSLRIAANPFTGHPGIFFAP
jgi:ABC-type hemin transport system ATPase subunit